MINEIQRLAYLDTMGIEVFVPRKILCGAKPSAACVLPKAVSPASQDNIDKPLAAKTPSTAALNVSDAINANRVVSTLLDEKPIVKNIPEATSENPLKNRSQQTRGSEKEALSFHLSIWFESDRLVVDTRNVHGALPTHTLLHNMLGAVCGYKPLSKPGVIKWPVMQLGSHALADAREFVAAYLVGKLSGKTIKHIWLLGKPAFDVLQKSNVKQDNTVDYKDALYKIQTVDSCLKGALVLPSLEETLKNPGLKKAIWQAMQYYERCS